VRSSWHSHLPHSPVIVHHAPEDISCLNRSRILTNNSIGSSMDVKVSDQNNKCAPGSTTTYPAEVPLESSTHVMARYVGSILWWQLQTSAFILVCMNLERNDVVVLKYDDVAYAWIFLPFFYTWQLLSGFCARLHASSRVTPQCRKCCRRSGCREHCHLARWRWHVRSGLTYTSYFSAPSTLPLLIVKNESRSENQLPVPIMILISSHCMCLISYLSSSS